MPCYLPSSLTASYLKSIHRTRSRALTYKRVSLKALSSVIFMVCASIHQLLSLPQTSRRLTASSRQTIPSLEEAYTQLYDVFIRNHLQRLIRVLDLRHNRLGWEAVRRRLSEQIPGRHQLHKLWLILEAEMLPGHCLSGSRLQERDRRVSALYLLSFYLLS